MISFLGAGATNSSLVEFFQSVIGSLSIDTILFIFAGVMAVVIVASILRLIWCYETRAMRQMKKINKYLKDNPKITESNLVEFHKRMRRLPRRFRDRWQLFMLEREGSPSRYMTVEYCVKRPLYNSAILMVKKQMERPNHPLVRKYLDYQYEIAKYRQQKIAGWTNGLVNWFLSCMVDDVDTQDVNKKELIKECTDGKRVSNFQELIKKDREN